MDFMDGKPPAVPNYKNHNNNNNVARPPPQAQDAAADFSATVERILASAEHRESSPPMLGTEMSQLSMLCSLQASRNRGIVDDLGFADVDPDLTGQLVETLEKHVALASSVELNKQAYTIIQKIKNKEYKFTIDQVSREYYM
jgi:hypothetical protein